jgi:hypothetical protein
VYRLSARDDAAIGQMNAFKKLVFSKFCRPRYL